VTVFGVVLVRVGRMDRGRLEHLAALPFEEDSTDRDRSGA
jgi:hypothetical protein